MPGQNAHQCSATMSARDDLFSTSRASISPATLPARCDGYTRITASRRRDQRPRATAGTPRSNRYRLNEAVAEAAVAATPTDIKGRELPHMSRCAQASSDRRLAHGAVPACEEEIGPIAQPDSSSRALACPRRDQGKFMRRILRNDRRGEHGLGIPRPWPIAVVDDRGERAEQGG